MPSCCCEAEVGQPVSEAVGHGLDPPAQLGVDLLRRQLVHPRRRPGVEVLSGGERLDQPGVTGKVGHDPHLDLAVVGGQQALVVGADDERLADLPALGLRTGMFCRFGSVKTSRPVAAIIWWNVVWMRPALSTIGISESTTVFSRATSRWRSSAGITGWSVCTASQASASASVV